MRSGWLAAVLLATPAAGVPAWAASDGEVPPAGAPAAAEAPATPAPASPAVVEGGSTPPAVVDAWGEALIARYYDGIGQQPSDAERTLARDTLLRLRFDGVSAGRVEAAVDRSLVLHVPGRAVPFHIAVPLRIEPEEADAPAPAGSLGGTPVAQPPATSDAILQRRQILEQQRNRERLYRQWRDRTRTKRALVGVGAPVAVVGYALTFVGAAARYNQGLDDPEVAWSVMVPLVGAAVHLGLTQDPSLLAPLILQGAGWATLIPGAILKVDWPYDDDPLAGWMLLPSAGGVVLAGRF